MSRYAYIGWFYACGAIMAAGAELSRPRRV